jgi:hypothetical protein
MAKKSSPGTRRLQKLGLVWRNKKKISQIINAYIYLPFFLVIIFCPSLTRAGLIFPSLWNVRQKWPLPLCVYSVDERSISVFFPKREHPREDVENKALAKVVVERTPSAFFYQPLRVYQP